jgi:chaperonin GroES
VSSDTKPTAPAAGRPPIRLLHDRVLVRVDAESAERMSSSGIVIPATAAMGKRLAWGTVVAAGPHVRQVDIGERVLFDPEDRAEVQLQDVEYLLLRERDVHGVAEPEATGRGTGLYL